MIGQLPSTRPQRNWQGIEQRTRLLILLLFLLATVGSLFPPRTNTPWRDKELAPTTDKRMLPPALGDATQPGGQLPVYELPAELIGKAEVAAARTADSATFDMGDGAFARLQGATPFHFQDSDGAWQAIDPRFVAVQGGWRNDTNTLQTSLAQRSSSAKIGTSAVGTGWEPNALLATSVDGRSSVLATVLPGDKATPGNRTVDSTAIRYAHSWSDPALQDQWQTSAGGVEYTLRLPALPTVKGLRPQHLALRTQLHLRPGTSLQVGGKPAVLPLETREALELVAADGTTLLLQPPSMYEQNDSQARVAGSYRIDATGDPSVVELLVRTPWDWLAARGRDFPVILDPLFQMRSPTEVRVAAYRQDRSFSDVRTLANPELGNYKDGVKRLLVRFQKPSLPPGTTIDRAYLVTTPIRTAFVNKSAHAEANVQLYSLTNDYWLGDNSSEPQWAEPAIATQLMRYSPGEETHAGVIWDVTTQARGWPGPGGAGNYGLMLRTENEFCATTPVGCGGFYFRNPSSWQNPELLATEKASNPDEISVEPSKSGGIRLLVFYTGPVLNENQVVDMTGAGRGVPAANAPYYHADHVYQIPPVPARWQAVVARGLGLPTGPPNPTSTNDPYKRELQGSVGLKLNSANEAIPFAEVLPEKDAASFLLLNGRRTPGQGIPYSLRVQSPGGNTPPPGYDVRLVGEKETLASALNVTSTPHPYSFDTGDPMALWNVQFPGGSNSRVDIVITADNITAVGGAPDTYFNFVRGFSARLIDGSGSAFQTATGGNSIAMGSNAPPTGNVSEVRNSNEGEFAGGVRMSSGIFTPGASPFALALQYDGPRLEVFTDKKCRSGEFVFSCPGYPKVERMAFSYDVRVTSCSAAEGKFPTAKGTCQRVKCPTNAFPPDNYKPVGGLGLWSESGWTTEFSTVYPLTVDGEYAPLIGPANSALAPTVAVVGGRIVYNGTNVRLYPDSMLLLIDCTPPSNTFGALRGYFTVFDGPMRRAVYPAIPNDIIGLEPDPPRGPGSSKIDPWFKSDRDGGDLANESFSIIPATGRAGGNATLRRAVGNNLFFNTAWSLDVTGWPGLTSSIGKAGFESAPDVAGLGLSLGTTFSLDTQPATGKAYTRQFFAVRASAGTVIQPLALGGASKPIQILLLQRGKSVPGDPSPRECEASCLDLRAPDDTFERPNRNWSMPDVHTNGQARTVAISRPGELMAYSTDHPAASPQEVAQEFSFDTFGAKVSVEMEPCDPGGPKVLVIKGETRMALPNVGKPTDPSSLITAGFKLCETSLRSVHMAFKTPVGVPLGNSGLFVTGLSGTVDIFPDYTTITFGIDVQAAPGGDGGLVKLHADITIDTRGLVKAAGTFSILKGVVGGTGNLWVGWNPLDIGFKVEVCFPYDDGNKKGACDGHWLQGMIRAHMWEGQGWQHRYPWLPDNNEKHIAAQISATIKIKEGQIFSWWFIEIPPFDFSLGIELAFGQFCTSGDCTTYEWGIKGKLVIVGYDIGLYYGFDEGFDFILGNDDHVLIDQHGGAQDVPLALNRNGAANLPVRRATAAVNGTATERFTVDADVENLLFALGWQAGSPQLSLVRPDGIEITAANAAAYSTAITGTTNSALMGVKNPAPGVWQANIANLRDDGAEHYQFVYFANHGAPGTAANPGSFLAPIQAEEDGTGTYTIKWQAPADTPPTATISLYYMKQRPPSGLPERETDNLQDLTPIVKNLPFNAGQYVWNTSALENGMYTLRAEVDDGINTFPSTSDPDDTCNVGGSALPSSHAFNAQRFPGTSVFSSTGTVQIMDYEVPTVAPTGLVASGVDGALMARWNVIEDQKFGSYIVRWGVRIGDTVAVLNQQRVTGSDEPSLRIGGLQNGTEYGFEVAAIAANGNVGPFSPPAFATPDAAVGAIPSEPINFRQTDANATFGSFAWDPAPGPASAGYRLEYRRLGAEGIAGQLDTTETSATISGLQPGATYDVRVSALNSDGWPSPNTGPLRFITTGGDGNGDGLPDEWATAYNLSSATDDADADGLTNIREYQIGTNPRSQNSDDDDFADAEEIAAGTDPYDSASYGTALTQPRLSISEDKLVFRAKRPIMAPIPVQTVIWSNTGGGTLNLQASTSAPWLQATVAGDTVQVGLNSGVESGYYSGVVRLLPAAGSDPLIGSPTCIRVEAWISPADNEFPTPTPTAGTPTPIIPTTTVTTGPDTRRKLYLPLVQK